MARSAKRIRSNAASLAVLQCLLIPLILLMSIIAPPFSGPVMLVSLSERGGDNLIEVTRAAGFYPLGPVTDDRFVVAIGSHRHIFSLMAHGIVPVRPPYSCGGNADSKKVS